MSIRSARSPRAIRRAGRIAAVALLTATIAACGGNSPTATVTTTAGPETSTAATPATTAAPVMTNAPTTTDAAVVPVSGGDITVAIEGESTGYNPQADAWGNGGHDVAKAIFDTLAAYDSTGKAVPYLAEAITANADSTVWTITLRPGIAFHNGEPLNADAVRLNFEAVLNSAQYKSQLALVASMKVIDDLNLEVTMSAPWGTFLNVLTGEIGAQVGYIAAPSMLASPDGGRNPIGTGPFTFVEWVPDDHLTVQRNDAYWQRPAYLDQVTFKPIPDSTSRKAAFDASDVSVYYTGVSKDIVAYLAAQEQGDVTVTIGAPSDPDMVMMNSQTAPLDDIRVRKALAMSVDLPRLYDYMEATGVKQPLHGPYADDSFWYVETSYPAYDPAGAKALIDEYIAEKGPVTFDFAGGQDPWLVSYQQLFQSMWSEIGVTANIVSRAQSENIDAVVNGDYQVILWGGIGGGDPDKDYVYFHSGTLNFSKYSSPTIDAAMDSGRATADPELRKEQYAIVQKELADAMPYIWTGTNQQAVIAHQGINGVADFTLPDGTPGQPVAGARFYLKDVWLEQ